MKNLTGWDYKGLVTSNICHDGCDHISKVDPFITEKITICPVNTSKMTEIHTLQPKFINFSNERRKHFWPIVLLNCNNTYSHPNPNPDSISCPWVWRFFRIFRKWNLFVISKSFPKVGGKGQRSAVSDPECRAASSGGAEVHRGYLKGWLFIFRGLLGWKCRRCCLRQLASLETFDWPGD